MLLSNYFKDFRDVFIKTVIESDSNEFGFKIPRGTVNSYNLDFIHTKLESEVDEIQKWLYNQCDLEVRVYDGEIKKSITGYWIYLKYEKKMKANLYMSEEVPY